MSELNFIVLLVEIALNIPSFLELCKYVTLLKKQYREFGECDVVIVQLLVFLPVQLFLTKYSPVELSFLKCITNSKFAVTPSGGIHVPVFSSVSVLVL